MRQAGDFCKWQNEVGHGFFDLTQCNVQKHFKDSVHNMTHRVITFQPEWWYIIQSVEAPHT